MNLPALPGSYALWLHVPEAQALEIGRLGRFVFPPGSYLYFGSALGPGGLRARVEHHIRLAAAPHWHLDYLRPHARLAGGWYCTTPTALECLWSQAVLRATGAALPAPGFGAADCQHGCAAHLLHLHKLDPGSLEELLARSARLPVGSFRLAG